MQYRLVKLDEVIIDESQPLAFDTETKGKYGKVCLAQFYQADWDEVLEVQHPCPFTLAQKLNNVHVIMQNGHYDITTIQQQTNTRWQPKRWSDVFLAARLHFYKEDSFSLDNIFNYVLGYDPYTESGIDKKTMQKSDYDVIALTEPQKVYAAIDVWHLLDAWAAVEHMEEDISYQLDMKFLAKCLDFQWNGMPVDPERLLLRYEKNQAEIIELQKRFPPGFNANSWQQVRKHLNSTQSDGLYLARRALQGCEDAKAIIDIRSLRKQLSFLDKFDAEGGRIYGKFKPSARSGRATSDDQNLQQIPRALKEVFGAPPGRVLVYADYAQLELRTICAITTCRLMEQLFREGKDLHGFTAEFIFGEAWEKFHRQVAKTCNFNLLYGGGTEMFISILIQQVGILMGEKEAHDIKRKWKRLWKEVAGWQQRGINAYHRGMCGSTPLGRRYKAKLMTDQLNIENQGAGAEVSKLATHYLDLPDHAFVCNFIHDSWIVECDEDDYEPVAKELARAMQTAWFEMSKCFAIKDLPMPVEVKVGTNWGDIENDDVPNIWDYELEGMYYADV